MNPALRYRKIFYEITEIDPFSCVTLAQACLDVYRKNFMPEKSIGIFKTRQDKYSYLALKWLRKIEAERGILIQHALNGGEKKIGIFYMDGFYENEIFSFNGCFFMVVFFVISSVTSNRFRMDVRMKRTINER